MIKSLFENGGPSEQTKEFYKELDLNLEGRDLSTSRIERYRTDLRHLKEELSHWRNKCAEAERNRDGNFNKYKEVQRSIELLEEERRNKRDISLMNRSSPNLSACSSMAGGSHIPPPPPPADITYDEIFNMTGNQQSSAYLVNHSTNVSNPYPIGAHPTIPPPPSPPQYTGDRLLKEVAAKMNPGSTGFLATNPAASGQNGRRVDSRSLSDNLRF